MLGSINPTLVLASLLAAIGVGYGALEMGARLATLDRPRRSTWLTVDAVAIGFGLWAMHVVGLSALRLGAIASYGLGLTLLSGLAALAAAALLLHLIGGQRMTGSALALGSVAIGACLSLMHYAGLWAMRLTPALGYEPFLLGVSIALAVSAGALTVFIGFNLRALRGAWRFTGRLMPATVIGAALCGVHYTALAAVRFPAHAVWAPGNTVHGPWLGLPVATAAIGLIAVVIVLGIADDRAAAQRRELAARRRVEERIRDRAYESLAPPSRARA